jgi:HTH-type transcriptional regulator / antitoxin MqsA
MAVSTGTPLNTMLSPETGELLSRGSRSFKVTFLGRSLDVDLPGYYPEGNGDGVHVGDDLEVIDSALRTLQRQGSDGA